MNQSFRGDVVLEHSQRFIPKDLRRTDEEHAKHVVNVAVLPSTMMNIVSWHGDFWSIEDRRLRSISSVQYSVCHSYFVHVVPHPEVASRALI